MKESRSKFELHIAKVKPLHKLVFPQACLSISILNKTGNDPCQTFHYSLQLNLKLHMQNIYIAQLFLRK